MGQEAGTNDAPNITGKYDHHPDIVRVDGRPEIPSVFRIAWRLGFWKGVSAGIPSKNGPDIHTGRGPGYDTGRCDAKCALARSDLKTN